MCCKWKSLRKIVLRDSNLGIINTKKFLIFTNGVYSLKIFFAFKHVYNTTCDNTQRYRKCGCYKAAQQRPVNNVKAACSGRIGKSCNVYEFFVYIHSACSKRIPDIFQQSIVFSGSKIVRLTKLSTLHVSLARDHVTDSSFTILLPRLFSMRKEGK